MTDSSTPANPVSSNAPETAASAATPASKSISPSRARRKAKDEEKPDVEMPKQAVKSAKARKAATEAVTELATQALLPDQEIGTACGSTPQTGPQGDVAASTAIGAESKAEANAKAHVIEASATVEAPPDAATASERPTTVPVETPSEVIDDVDDSERLIQEPRVWQDDGWTARVMKNEDDEGWAVAMTLDGEPEPALVGPWTMGRDKKNPKPMDANAFSVLVKTAYEVRRRHEQAMHAMLHKSVMVDYQGDRCKISLQIVPDEYEPHAFLRAFDPLDDLLAEVRVEANFKLSNQSAAQWVANDFRRPGGY